MMDRFVYALLEAAVLEDARVLLGGKKSGLATMSRLGLAAPLGFVIPIEACRAYMGTGEPPDGLMEYVAEHLKSLEEITGKRIGDPDNPLLVSVRSGSAISMPGKMGTVLTFQQPILLRKVTPALTLGPHRRNQLAPAFLFLAPGLLQQSRSAIDPPPCLFMRPHVPCIRAVCSRRLNSS
jgi:hypothetical protein